MDCVKAAVMRNADFSREMVMSAAATAVAGHCQHQLLCLQSPFSSSLPAEEAVVACAPVDCSGLIWEGLSVDDLLDFGGGKEQNGGEEEFLRVEEAEEKEEEEEEEERKDSPTDFNNSSSSVLSLQELPPSTEPIVPAGDVADLEWLSRFVDDSYSEYQSSDASPLQNHHAPTPAPEETAGKALVPKPQSTSASTTSRRTWENACFWTDSLVVPAKARSKRSRTGCRVWSLSVPFLLAESSSSCSSGSSSSSCSASSSTSSCLLDEKVGSGGGVNPHRFLDCVAGRPPFNVQYLPAQLEVKKKKGRKPKVLAGVTAAADGSGSNGGEPQTRRRCSHCGVDKTPQWRAGPMGAKTLCNACGVRYKSGRLLPEYRPAGSPTFLSHLHSNSHRKVLEMRRKNDLAAAATATPASCSPLPPPLPAMAVASQPYGVV